MELFFKLGKHIIRRNRAKNKSKKNAKKAIKYCDYNSVSLCSTSIGYIYYDMSKFGEAIYHFNNSIAWARVREDKGAICSYVLLLVKQKKFFQAAEKMLIHLNDVEKNDGTFFTIGVHLFKIKRI